VITHNHQKPEKFTGHIFSDEFWCTFQIDSVSKGDIKHLPNHVSSICTVS